MNSRFEDPLSKISSQLTKLKDKLSQSLCLIEEINSLTDMQMLLRKTKGLSQDIDKISHDTVKAIEDAWLSITDDLDQHLKMKFDGLKSQIEARRDLLGLGQFAEAGKLAVDLVLESLRTSYSLTVYRTIRSLQEENLLSVSDLEELGVHLTDWTKNIALDLIPASGTLLKILNLLTYHFMGEEIEEMLWNSWTDKIRREKSFDLLQKANKKAMMVISFFSEYHLPALKNALHLENVIKESTKASDR